MCLSVRLPACLPAYLPARLSACLPVCLSVRLSPLLPCRALDGDVVAVELLPESQWRGASAHLPQADAESTTGGDEEDGDDPEGGHIAPQVLTHLCCIALSQPQRGNESAVCSNNS